MEVDVSTYSTLEDEGWVKIVCRLCGQEWLYPPDLARCFDEEHLLECSYCKGARRRGIRGMYGVR